VAARLRSADRRLIRGINQALVLGLIRDRGPISRTAVAAVARLSPATVSAITAELIEQGLVHETEPGASTGGRRPILLALNRGAALVLGVKLTETTLVAALADLGARVVDQRATPLGPDRSPEAVVAHLAETVEALRAAHPGRRVVGLGLGLAGVVDRAAGVCRFSPFLRWRDVPLRRLLEARLDLPVVIENDVNTLALAEQWFGAGVGVADFLVVTLGRGVGLGMVLDGRLYRGGRGGGGEFGHVTVDPQGPRCQCGKRGCLEALVSDPALLAQSRRALGPGVSLPEAVRRARGGDAAAQAVFAAAGRTLGAALAALVNLLDPPLIIVGGEGAGTLDLMLEPMREALAAGCFADFGAGLRLVVEPWGDDAWAHGAASLMLEELFRPPLYQGDEARVTWSAAVTA
jgi:N-acetylglucosamine repressor